MITEVEFHRYVKLQLSGELNMADRPTVATMLGIRVEDVKEIQDRYEDLEEKYGNRV